MAVIRPFLLAAALAAASSLVSSPSGHAHSYKAGNLTIGHPWSRATVGVSRPGVAYLSITNSGTVPDRLIAAETPVAGRVEMHESRMEGGRMTMKPVAALDIPPGGKVIFKPGGYHFMLLDLRQPMKDGETVPMTLTFEKAGKVRVELEVGPIGGAPTEGRASGGHMHH